MKNGLKTGIKLFDEIVGEVQKGELIVIAGRHGMGKTTLALQILAKNCLNKKCAYLSSIENITNSTIPIACILGNVKREENEKEVWESVNKVIDSKVNNTLHLLTFELDFLSLCIELTKIKMEKGLDILFIDGFQEFTSDLSVDLRTKWLKTLAQALDITIFVTTQMKLSPDCDRIDCTTIPYPLYESADKVLGIYRKDYFMTIADLERIKHGESFLCVMKSNNGKQGAVTAYFSHDHCAFLENFPTEE